MRRRSTTALIALSLLLAAGCSSGSTVGLLPGDHPDPGADGSAPPAAGSPSWDPRDERAGRALDGVGAGSASPAATSDPAAGAPTSPGSATEFTPGHGTAPSQPIGRGYVDASVENRLPGTAGWQGGQSTRTRTIEGYADSTSYPAGRPARLFVSSTAGTFRVQLLRLGWYGGVGARQVWLSEPVRGGVQARARQDPTTRMFWAPWQVSATVPTDQLVAGDYVAKLLGADGAASFVPFAVREHYSTGAVLLVNSTLTWLAYNPWGGANAYTASGAPTKAEGFDERSVVSSYDRPYARGSGTGGLFDEEYNLVLTAERLGLPLNYASDVDLHGSTDLLSGASGVALLGHSEYWSRQMRANLTAARDAGVNLAFLGANDIYRRLRLQPSANGANRQMTNYKVGTDDPVKTEDTTADWPKPPFKDPEASLTGVQYRCAKARADLVIADPGAWLLRGLGLAVGQRLPGMVGPEFDRVSLGTPTPRPIQIMAHSPVSCYGYPEYSDLAWYSAPSGAGVFAAGTLDWNAGISNPDPLTRTVVTTVTERVLKAIVQPQAGRTTPAVDNCARYYSPAGVPLDAKGRPVPLPKG